MDEGSAEVPASADLPPPLISVETDRDESLPGTIVRAVSAVSDTPSTELPVLNDVVDTDALDALFAGRSGGGCVVFRYAGYSVSVRDDVVRIHETDSALD